MHDADEPKRPGRKPNTGKYPFHTLTKLGDNFFIPAETLKEKRLLMKEISHAASSWCRHRGISPNPFATDREFGGVRCTFLDGDALTIRLLARRRIARKYRRLACTFLEGTKLR